MQIFLTLIEMNWPLPFIRATQTLVFSPKDKSFVHKDTINALSLVPGYYILNKFFFFINNKQRFFKVMLRRMEEKCEIK